MAYASGDEKPVRIDLEVSFDSPDPIDDWVEVGESDETMWLRCDSDSFELEEAFSGIAPNVELVCPDTEPEDFELSFDLDWRGANETKFENVTLTCRGEASGDQVSSIEVERGELDTSMLVLTYGDQEICSREARSPTTPPRVQTQPPGSEPDPPDRESVSLVASTREYLARECEDNQKYCDHTREPIIGPGLRVRYTLYHLPNGEPAFHYPSTIREVDEIRLKIFLPRGFAVTSKVEECTEINPARIHGSYQSVIEILKPSEEVGDLQTRPDGDSPDRTRAPDFVKHRLGTVTGCHGDVVFVNQVATVGPDDEVWHVAVTNTLRVRPMYRFVWSFMPVFDFAQRPSYSIGERTVPATEDSEATLEKYVAESSSLAGIRPTAALTVFPWRADPQARCCNPGVTIAVDPLELSGGMVGVSVFLGAHIGVTAGVSIYGRETLREGSNVSAEDSWTSPGDLPVETGFFDGQDIGAFVGVNLSPMLFRGD